MRIEPKIDTVVNGDRGMLQGIAVALKAECLVSAVGLMFSAIDSLAALARPTKQTKTTRKDFIDWAEKYLEPATSLGCTATDLYAARCGVLHTYSAESDLERGGKRRLIYEWRRGPAADASLPLPPNCLVLTVEKLDAAIRKGVAAFLIDSEMDPDTRERVTYHLKSLLCYAPWPNLEVTVAA